MDIQNFNQIIDFAVSKEKEAVQYYNNLKQNAKFVALKEMLQEFEDMEKAHIINLENIRKKFDSIKDTYHINKNLKNFKISDYLEEVPEPKTYSDYIIAAMKREEKALLLYNKLSELYSDVHPEISNLFSILANEEKTHKMKFEKIYEDEVLKDN